MIISTRKLVDRGLEIRAEMKQLKAALEDIEAKLEQIGLSGVQEDLVDADRDGKRFLAEGTSKIISVVFTADKIIGSFKAKSATHTEILAASNGRLGNFYLPETKFEARFDSGKKFRIEAKNILGEKAGEFISACLARDKFGVPKSDVKIEWDKGVATV